MTGKQFSFFLSQSDQLNFENALLASGNIAFLKFWPTSPEPEELATSQVHAPGAEILDVLIARREDLPLLKFSPVKGRNCFSCDVTVSPVVEFGRCYVTDRFVRAGRLYRVDQYWNEGQQLVRKPQEFVDWAERLYRMAKDSLTKVEQGCYGGAGAIELRKAGLAFEGLDIEVGAFG